MSHRARGSAKTGEPAAVEVDPSARGHEGWSSVAYNHSLRHPGRAPLGTPEVVRRRRVAAAEARHRRLRLVDLALGLVLALVAILLAPGLAIIALLAAAGLLACAASFAFRRVRRRRAGSS